MTAKHLFATSEKPAGNVALSDPAANQQHVRSKFMTKSTFIGLLAILAVGALLRAWNFPRFHEVRDVDEIGYMSSGLVLWEGMIPGFHASPAGPQTWLSWAYAAGKSSWYLVHPTGAIAAAPSKVRPLLAIDAALFDIYQDMAPLHRYMVAISFVIAMGGIYGAYRLGAYYGGLWTGVALGGLVAVLPMFVEYAAQSKPYSDAWSFALLSLYSAAVLRGSRRCAQTGIFLGLAAASRIEMISLLPLVLWMFWDNKETVASWKPAMKTAGIAAVVVMCVAPWLLTSVIGFVRTVVTIRVTGVIIESHPRMRTLLELSWTQGLAVVALLVVIGWPVMLRAKSLCRWVLLLYGALMVLSMFSGPYVPTKYHSVPLIVGLTFAGLVMAEISNRWPNAVGPLAGVLLVLPAIATVRQVIAQRSDWVDSDPTAWIEEHVPPGTPVYVSLNMNLRTPLPTPASADAIWSDVTDSLAWRRKFQRGLERFHLDSAYFPRALSEDNLVLDRSLIRRYFILGSEPQVPRPRYDVQLIFAGPVFGVRDLPGTFATKGGVVIWNNVRNESSKAPAFLGKPIVQWTTDTGMGNEIYCSPEVAAKLTDWTPASPAPVPARADE
jgi:hypothetical protein